MLVASLRLGVRAALQASRAPRPAFPESKKGSGPRPARGGAKVARIEQPRKCTQ